MGGRPALPEHPWPDQRGAVMAKRFPAHRIKAHWVYTIWEASQALNCHKRTVERWIKQDKLVADTSQRPFMINRRDLKAFLGARQVKARTRLALHHCYCLGCKGPREPDGRIADYVHQTAESGRLTGLCPDCGALIHKIIRRSDLEAIQAKLEVTVQKANPRLVSQPEPLSNVSVTQERQPHGKAQTR